MPLPLQIPERLRSSFFTMPDFDDGEAGWSQADALAVIESLERTLVAVASIRVFEPVPWGFAPTDNAWAGDRLYGELNTDYAERTRVAAADFIRTHGGDTDRLIFVLGFPVEKDAA